MIPAGESNAVVFDVPGDDHFVLIQACLSLSGPFLPFPSPQWLLTGSQLGAVSLGFGCTTFDPGVASSSTPPCLVNGALQPLDRHPGKGRR